MYQVILFLPEYQISRALITKRYIVCNDCKIKTVNAMYN